MSTNYYLVQRPRDPCPHCERPYEPERLHIGKAAAGWCFMLHVETPETRYPQGPRSFKEWERAFYSPDHYIEDQYGGRLHPQYMIDIITKRAGRRDEHGRPYVPPGRGTRAQYLEANHAVEGPNGLMRVRVGGNCIGHAPWPGTYDLLVGEFS